MSHNVFVSGVIFDDINTLEKAFIELRSEGKLPPEAMFHSDGYRIRGYSSRNAEVDAAISLPGQPYDVGFRKTAEGYVPFFESGFHPSGLAAEYGAEDINGGNACHASAGAVGQLAQRYRVLQLERNARINGMTTRRQFKEKGQMALEVVHTR